MYDSKLPSLITLVIVLSAINSTKYHVGIVNTSKYEEGPRVLGLFIKKQLETADKVMELPKTYDMKFYGPLVTTVDKLPDLKELSDKVMLSLDHYSCEKSLSIITNDGSAEFNYLPSEPSDLEINGYIVTSLNKKRFKTESSLALAFDFNFLSYSNRKQAVSYIVSVNLDITTMRLFHYSNHCVLVLFKGQLNEQKLDKDLSDAFDKLEKNSITERKPLNPLEDIKLTLKTLNTEITRDVILNSILRTDKISMFDKPNKYVFLNFKKSDNQMNLRSAIKKNYNYNRITPHNLFKYADLLSDLQNRIKHLYNDHHRILASVQRELTNRNVKDTMFQLDAARDIRNIFDGLAFRSQYDVQD